MIEHIHHWLIATPDGVECPAFCECGQSRMFSSAGKEGRPWRNCKECGEVYNSTAHKKTCK